MAKANNSTKNNVTNPLKKSIIVDSKNNSSGGSCCRNFFCKACSCFKMDLLITPTGSLKIIELILGVSCLLLISHHDVAFFLNERLTSSVMLFLCPTSVHNGAVLLICYLGSHKTFSMVRPSLFEVFINFSSAFLYVAPCISLLNKSVDVLVQDPDIIGTYILGFFLGVVHFIDAILAYMEHRKFKIQIISTTIPRV